MDVSGELLSLLLFPSNWW